MLLWPLFTTSFLIDDFLEDNQMFGAQTIILSSASSKTAFCLHQRGTVRVVGLTSPGNVEFVRSLGCHDEVVAYDDVASLPSAPTAYVDMAGSGPVRASVHEHFGDLLTSSCMGRHPLGRPGQRRGAARAAAGAVLRSHAGGQAQRRMGPRGFPVAARGFVGGVPVGGQLGRSAVDVHRRGEWARGGRQDRGGPGRGHGGRRRRQHRVDARLNFSCCTEKGSAGVLGAVTSAGAMRPHRECREDRSSVHKGSGRQGAVAAAQR